MSKSKSKKMATSKRGKPTYTAPPTHATDLVLTLEGNTLTTTISPDAQWAGIQKFVDITTNDGAVSIGNWNYSSPAGEGATKSVEAQGTGHYRGWSTDFTNGDVHVSNWVDIP